MPTQEESDLFIAGERNRIPHSYVYRRYEGLQAGKTYHFKTANLRPLQWWPWWQWALPDPVMYLVHNNDIVAYNDDYTGLASEIIYTPQVAGTYQLFIRAHTTSTPGLCDLYRGVDGAPPSLVDQNLKFAGTYVSARWKGGESFETNGLISGSDPYLFLIQGNKIYWDDDSGPGLNSKITPASSGTGTVIVGSYSRYSEGNCSLYLIGQSYKAPWLSPAPWAPEAEPTAPPKSLQDYMEQLKKAKPALEKLSPDERDIRVLELQRKMLSEEEIRIQSAPFSRATPEFVRRQKEFLARYGKIENELDKMAHLDRSSRLVRLKKEVLGAEFSEPAESA